MSQDNTRVDLPKEDKIPKLYNPYTTLDEKFGNIGSHYFQDKEDVVADKAKELAYQGLFGDESENTNLMTGAVPFADAAIKLSEGKQPGILDIAGDLKVPAMAMIPIAKWGKGVKKGERIGKNARNIEKAKLHSWMGEPMNSDREWFEKTPPRAIKRYHATPVENVEDILKQGLNPRCGDDDVVYTSVHPNSYIPHDWWTKEPQDYVELELNIPKENYRYLGKASENPSHIDSDMWESTNGVNLKNYSDEDYYDITGNYKFETRPLKPISMGGTADIFEDRINPEWIKINRVKLMNEPISMDRLEKWRKEYGIQTELQKVADEAKNERLRRMREIRKVDTPFDTYEDDYQLPYEVTPTDEHFGMRMQKDVSDKRNRGKWKEAEANEKILKEKFPNAYKRYKERY